MHIYNREKYYLFFHLPLFLTSSAMRQLFSLKPVDLTYWLLFCDEKRLNEFVYVACDPLGLHCGNWRRRRTTPKILERLPSVVAIACLVCDGASSTHDTHRRPSHLLSAFRELPRRLQVSENLRLHCSQNASLKRFKRIRWVVQYFGSNPLGEPRNGELTCPLEDGFRVVRVGVALNRSRST